MNVAVRSIGVTFVWRSNLSPVRAIFIDFPLDARARELQARMIGRVSDRSAVENRDHFAVTLAAINGEARLESGEFFVVSAF